MDTSIDIFTIHGKETQKFASDLFRLRVQIFREFPYLYDGELEKEHSSDYHNVFFDSIDATMIIAKDKQTNEIIGISTSNTFKNELMALQNIFLERSYDTSKYYYFRESVILPQYRGQGIGKRFFEEREKIARMHSKIEYITLFGVVRPENHPLKPHGYQYPYALWRSQGFIRQDHITHAFEWKVVQEKNKIMNPIVFWIKSL